MQQGESFKVAFDNVFSDYIQPQITTKAGMNAWNDTPMKFWQNQMNFAVWCTDHFNNENKKLDLCTDSIFITPSERFLSRWNAHYSMTPHGLLQKI